MFRSAWQERAETNSPVYLILTDPSGIQHICPMEFDPDAPNATTYGATYQLDVDPDGANTQLLHPVGDNVPVRPLPEESAALVPAPSSSFQ